MDMLALTPTKLHYCVTSRICAQYQKPSIKAARLDKEHQKWAFLGQISTRLKSVLR